MKTTKILGIAVAAVAALSFASCKNANVKNAIGEVTFEYNPKTNATTGAEATANVNFTNANVSEYARGMLTFNNKKKGITAKIVMQGLDTNASNPGLMGIVFNMKKVDGKYNFCVLGFKNNGGHPKAYVSYYTGVSEADFSKQDFGVAESARKDIADWFDLNEITRVADGNLSLVVEIEALKSSKDDTTGDGEKFSVDETYAYNIYFYKDEFPLSAYKDISNKPEEGTENDDKIKISDSEYITKKAFHERAKRKIQVKRGEIGIENLNEVEAKMGFYANVYGGQTLKGEWQVADMKHNPNVAKTAADTQDNPLNIKFID